jgi:hypothetical protein
VRDDYAALRRGRAARYRFALPIMVAAERAVAIAKAARRPFATVINAACLRAPETDQARERNAKAA